MEPGHEDREYTGCTPDRGQDHAASMEPGHEDREYQHAFLPGRVVPCASMEPGHEDREYSCGSTPPGSCSESLNGARS